MPKIKIENANSLNSEEVIEKKVVKSNEIIVNDPQILRPKELPLVIVLPEDASNAQIEFAKVLNAYAYKNPEKWAIKKDDRVVNGAFVKGLITILKELKDAPDPVKNSNLSYGNKLLN